VSIPTIILVADDEPLVRDIIEAVLEEGGYAVRLTSSGAEALLALESTDEPLRALITDVNPGCGPSGWDVARRARELNQTLPVIYMTGDSGYEWPSPGVPNSLLLIKPFAPSQLVTAISSLSIEAHADRAMEDPAPE
jgi:CheY-like chemotaxis protein